MVATALDFNKRSALSRQSRQHGKPVSMLKTISLALIFSVTFLFESQAQIICAVKTSFDLSEATIVVDQKDFDLVKKAALLLQQDIEAVTGKKIPIQYAATPATQNSIIIGTITKAAFIKTLAAKKRLTANVTNGTWEAFQVKVIDGNLIIAG